MLHRILIIMLGITFGISGCFATNEEVNVYSARKEKLIKPL